MTPTTSGGGCDRSRTPSSPLRVLRRTLVVLGLTLVALVPFSPFIVPGLVAGTEADVQEGIVFTELEGREVALLTYHDSSIPRLGALFGAGSEVIAAVDTETGETVWTGSLPARFETLVAAGDEYAYLAGVFGEPAIVQVSDGSLVAQGEEVTGVGPVSPRRAGDYRYAPDREAVLLATGAGELLMIPLDELTAVPADQDTIETWGCLVGGAAHSHAPQTGRTGSTPHPDGGTLSIGPAPGDPLGLPAQRLLLTDEEGTRPLGPAVIHSHPEQLPGMLTVEVENQPLPRACPDRVHSSDVYAGGRAATWATVGASSDLVVVVAPSGSNDTTLELIVLDATTGSELAREPVGRYLGEVYLAPSGRILVGAHIPLAAPGQFLPAKETDVFYLIDTDGSTTRLAPGENGWFGL